MNPPKFKYRGFGLNIGSDVEFPELFPFDFEAEDVRIDAGPIDDPWFESNAMRPYLQQIDPDRYRCQIPDAANTWSPMAPDYKWNPGATPTHPPFGCMP